MSEEGSVDIFDVDRIRALVQMMIDHGLSEVDLRQHGQTIRLRRGGENPVSFAPPTRVVSASPIPAPAAPSNEEEDVVLVKSPMVGTFYRRANPESEPFVQVGSEISPDQTICIIEAMKVFNEIPAEVAGKVVAILVEDDEPVEFGRPLFKIRPLR